MAQIHLGRISFVLTIISMLIISSFIIQSAMAISEWNQTTYEDFRDGYFNNITLEKKGSEFELGLGNVPVSWTDMIPKQAPGVYHVPVMATIWGTGEVLLFNGDNGTWTYNSSTNKWVKKTNSDNPPVLYGHAMAPIYGTDKVVLFGGMDWSDNTFPNKTWVFDLSDDIWTLINTSKAPKTYFHAMASIWGTDKIVMFGGYGSILPNTWVFDYSNKTWTRMSPSTSPMSSYYHAMASVWGTDMAVLFGGFSTQLENKTWVYDLSADTWTDKKPISSPLERSYYTMTSIYGYNKVTLFGGITFNGYQNDLWIYDLNLNTWTQMGANNIPKARYLHSMASSWGVDEAVLFGGYGGVGGYTSDTWVLHLNIGKKFKNGSYFSPCYDVEYGSVFKGISWSSTNSINTSLKFQVRTAQTETKLDLQDFVGPDGTVSTFYEASPSAIWDGHYNYRWFQYKASFTSTDEFDTPYLHNVSVIYNNLPETTLAKPDDGMIFSFNQPEFIWWFKDHDSASQAAFQILIDNTSSFSEPDFDSGEIPSSEQSWRFPEGTSYTTILDGTWYWKARTKDNDGDWGLFSDTRKIRIDTQLPNSNIEDPVDNGCYKKLDRFSGKASDPVTGTGLKKVEISIRRSNDNFSWDGDSWKQNQKWIIATGTTSWHYDSSNIKWESDHEYAIRSRAIDNATNIEPPTAEIAFMIDYNWPSSSIQYPLTGAFLTEPEPVIGIASDKSGSGIAKVELTIQRSEDKRYWTGTDWDANKHWLPAEGGDNWSFDTSSFPWTTDKNYRIESRATDILGNAEDVRSSSTFMYDDQPPDISFAIKDKTTYITKPDVILLIGASDTGSGIDGMSLSINGHDWLEWEAVAAELEYVFKGGDGLKNIHVRVKDRAGNIAEPLSESVTLDTTPPAALSIIINKNADFTNILKVDLDLHAEDALSGIDMMSIGYDEKTWSDWEPYAIKKEFPLENKNGIRTLLFRVRDKAGNADQISDTIILDTEPPHSQLIIINRNNEVTDIGEVMLTIKATDKLTGVELMSFSSDGTNWTDWEDYKELLSKPYTLTAGDGIKTVYFRSKDRAGNTALAVFDTIVLITEEPEKDEGEQLVITGVESSMLIFILIIIAVIISVSLVSMVYYKKRKDRIKEEREAVLRSNPPSQVLKPKANVLPAGPKMPQLPVAESAVSEPAKPQLPPAQIGIPTPTEPTPTVPTPALPTSTIPTPTVPTSTEPATVPTPTGTVDATEQIPEQPEPEWSALFDKESSEGEKKEDYPCSSCGDPLTKVSDEGKFYCYTCQKYE